MRNEKVVKESNEMILDIFWKVFRDFQRKTSSLGNQSGQFLVPNAF